MSNLFDNIGIEVRTDEDYSNILTRTLENGAVIDVKNGKYFRWLVGKGIEIIAGINDKNKPISLKPHFFGNTKFEVKLTKDFKNMGTNQLSGNVMCWSEPLAETDEGKFPFVVDMPEFAVYDFSILPVLVEIQVTAFAKEVTVFKSKDEYMDFQKGKNKFEVKSFVPIGMFEDDGMYKNNPDPLGVITGEVVETTRLNNEFSGEEFRWIRLSTVGGEIDVVYSDSISSEPVEKGHILGGMFYLSGRVVGELKKPADE